MAIIAEKEKVSNKNKDTQPKISIGKRFYDWLVTQEGGKPKVKPKSATYLGGGIAAIVVFGLLSRGFFEDTSTLQQTDSAIETKGSKAAGKPPPSDSNVDNLFGESSDADDSEGRKVVTARREPYKYKAKQVIKREDSNFDRSKVIPIGTNFIGQLLTSIDTRESEQLYKVFLPYGGKFKGGAEIPKGSTLFGKIRYSGKGSKVFLNFSKGVFPNGKEFAIQAQALSSRDYSPGILGDFHGQAGSRIAATLGLSMISAGADVLQEREALGGGLNNSVAVKPSLKNAMYAGVARGAEVEAARQAEALNEREEYVTIDAGKDLIINLTGEYKE